MVAMSDSFSRHRRAMSAWLLTVCAMTAAMVVLGGLTRLTQSGLSMTDWSLAGGLPPLTEAAWQAEFARYQQFPEYQLINHGMTLVEFQLIYAYEYSHRMLGRTIGAIYLLPMLYFVARRAVPWSLAPKLVGLLGLLLAQGLIGWWMVQSGLVDRPDVSHLRLTTHLGMAFAFFGALWWVALSLGRADVVALQPGTIGLKRLLGVLAAMVYGTVLLGGLVAGSDAGLSYNTFPLMGGRIVPPGYLAMSPWWHNMLENIASIQFNHRLLALTTLAVVVGAWAWSRRLPLAVDGRRALGVLLAAAVLQVVLGITTLLTVVWLPAASLHQTGALVLLAVVLWAVHVVARPAASVGTSSARAVTMRVKG
jgi:cytochrome c oxidase assembly protein subunit 15